MSTHDYLVQARTAGAYMQAFIRSKQETFQDAKIGCSHKAGWTGRGVSEASNAAGFLYEYTNEHFFSCRIPEDYGSPAALRDALTTLEKSMGGFEDQLNTIIEKSGRRTAQSVPIALEHIKSTRYAAAEALRQLLGTTTFSTSDTQKIIGAVIPSPMEIVQEIANRFPDVVARLKTRRSNRPSLMMTDEFDVQYLFQALLSVPFLDVRPEEPTPSVAGGTGRGDTLLKAERIVVEYKRTRKGLSDVQLRKQIADDLLLYSKCENCDRLFVFVYDPDQLVTNPSGLEKDLNVHIKGLEEVRVVIRR